MIHIIEIVYRHNKGLISFPVLKTECTLHFSSDSQPNVTKIKGVMFCGNFASQHCLSSFFLDKAITFCFEIHKAIPMTVYSMGQKGHLILVHDFGKVDLFSKFFHRQTQQ